MVNCSIRPNGPASPNDTHAEIEWLCKELADAMSTFYAKLNMTKVEAKQQARRETEEEIWPLVAQLSFVED